MAANFAKLPELWQARSSSLFATIGSSSSTHLPVPLARPAAGSAWRHSGLAM
jgi:hypothetical protein